MKANWAETNQHGVWCTVCGELLSRDTEYIAGDECPTCGAPDDIEQMAQFFCGEDDDD